MGSAERRCYGLWNRMFMSARGLDSMGVIFRAPPLTYRAAMDTFAARGIGRPSVRLLLRSRPLATISRPRCVANGFSIVPRVDIRVNAGAWYAGDGTPIGVDGEMPWG